MIRTVIAVSLALVAAQAAPAAPLDIVDRTFLCQSGRTGALPGFYVQVLTPSSWTHGGVALMGQTYGPNSKRVSAAHGQPGLDWARDRCRQTSTRIPLDRAGLPRLTYRDTAKCTIGGAILVRVRAVRLNGKLVESQIAVRMQNKRRAMAYGIATRNGEARLYTRPGCMP